MNRKRNIVVLSILFIVLVGICLVEATYFKPHVNVAESTPDISLATPTLLNDFQNDENKANTAYLEKIIMVSGKILELTTADGNGVITLDGEGAFGSVICHLSPEENKKLVNLKEGQNISIKGICTGYLMDVILVKCVIIN